MTVFSTTLAVGPRVSYADLGWLELSAVVSRAPRSSNPGVPPVPRHERECLAAFLGREQARAIVMFQEDSLVRDFTWAFWLVGNTRQQPVVVRDIEAEPSPYP